MLNVNVDVQSGHSDCVYVLTGFSCQLVLASRQAILLLRLLLFMNGLLAKQMFRCHGTYQDM